MNAILHIGLDGGLMDMILNGIVGNGDGTLYMFEFEALKLHIRYYFFVLGICAYLSGKFGDG